MTYSANTEFEAFAFFELTPDLVCVAGRDGYFKSVNPAVIKKLGYTREELFARPIDSFIHPEDKELTKRERANLLNGKTLINFQNRYVARSGKVIWFEWTSVYIPDKEIVFAIAKDITERKLAEKEIEEKYIKFKGLATHFKSNLEENRKYLALELHEELAQLATTVKMDIDWISSKEPGLPEFSRKRILHASAVADLLISTIRRISFSVSPNVLDDLGLNAALEWQCKEFSVLNGIPCQFEKTYEETHLTREVKLDFFRICQEALTNIMYHAQASRAEIRIEDRDKDIILSITDDGIGFEIEQQTQIAGLTSIRERVASINGHVTIKSEPGKGTSIVVTAAKKV